jgi:hypothetical protein
VGYLVFIGQNSKSIDGLPKWEHILGCFPILAALALVRHLPRSVCVVAGSLRCACSLRNRVVPSRPRVLRPREWAPAGCRRWRRAQWRRVDEQQRAVR